MNLTQALKLLLLCLGMAFLGCGVTSLFSCYFHIILGWFEVRVFLALGFILLFLFIMTIVVFDDEENKEN